jgi:hypothetical protein
MASGHAVSPSFLVDWFSDLRKLQVAEADQIVSPLRSGDETLDERNMPEVGARP